MSVFEEASKIFPEERLFETAVVESFKDTDKMRDMLDKMQNTTVPSRCQISMYDLASRDEKRGF